MEDAQSPHHLEPAFQERSLEAVSGDLKRCDCAHRSEAALWNRSFEAVCKDLEDAHSPHHLEPAPREHSLQA
eukprot:5462873-Amphidinium_carterae.1